MDLKNFFELINNSNLLSKDDSSRNDSYISDDSNDSYISDDSNDSDNTNHQLTSFQTKNNESDKIIDTNNNHNEKMNNELALKKLLSKQSNDIDNNHNKKINKSNQSNKSNKSNQSNHSNAKSLLKNKSNNCINGNQQISGDNQIDGDCFVNGNIYLNENLITKSNLFIKNNIFLNDSLNLLTEKINLSNLIKINYNYISNDSYKYLLTNVLDSIKNINTNLKTFSSIKFFSEKNKYIAPTILAVNKKFIINNEIFLSSGLFYVIFIKKKILVANPIMDTFIIINKKYDVVIINDNFFNDTINNNNINNVENKIDNLCDLKQSNELDEIIKVDNLESVNKDNITNKNIKKNKKTVKLDDFIVNILVNSLDKKTEEIFISELNIDKNDK